MPTPESDLEHAHAIEYMYFEWLDSDVSERVAKVIRGLLKRLDKQETEMQRFQANHFCWSGQSLKNSSSYDSLANSQHVRIICKELAYQVVPYTWEVVVLEDQPYAIVLKTEWVELQLQHDCKECQSDPNLYNYTVSGLNPP
nr:uncharacterized protein LOC109193259 [Ipomoea batatas]GME21706.1 uncharacterized protein LOC109193259 [Ipomoea batatas]